MRAKVVLFKGKKLVDNTYPLSLKLSQGDKKKYISIGVSIPESEWNIKELKKVNKVNKTHSNYEKYNDYNNLKKKIDGWESKYNNAIISLTKELDEFTIDQLIAEVGNKKRTKKTVFEYFDQRIKFFHSSKRIGNAVTYQNSLRQLKNYRNNKDLTFREITQPFIKKYIETLQVNGLKDTSISTYIRTFRAVYKSAVKDLEAAPKPPNEYPFDGQLTGLSNLNLSTEKRGLGKSDVNEIREIKMPKNVKMDWSTINDKNRFWHAKNLFMFGYLGRGIDFVDIAYLKWSNLDKETKRISYKRAKARNRKKNRNVSATFAIDKEIEQILSCYRLHTGIDNDNYIFPILNKHIHKTDQQQFDRLKKVRAIVNRGMKDLSKKAKIEMNLTTKVTRHTFATVLKRQNVPTTAISELLVHSDVGVTETYLSELDPNTLDEYTTDL